MVELKVLFISSLVDLCFIFAESINGQTFYETYLPLTSAHPVQTSKYFTHFLSYLIQFFILNLWTIFSLSLQPRFRRMTEFSRFNSFNLHFLGAEEEIVGNRYGIFSSVKGLAVLKYSFSLCCMSGANVFLLLLLLLQIVMKIPWMSRKADKNEDELKMALARE